MGSNKGFILLHRSIMENPAWDDPEPWSKGQAWIDLIMLANYQATILTIEGKKVQVQRGEVLTSIRKLAERWHWSTTKVRTYLMFLSEQNMIEQRKGSSRYTVIFLKNYEKYQSVEKATDTVSENQTKTSYIAKQILPMEEMQKQTRGMSPMDLRLYLSEYYKLGGRVEGYSTANGAYAALNRKGY